MADRDPARPGTGALGGQAVLGATAHMNEPPVDGAREADERTIEIEQAPTVYDSHTASANEKEKFSDDSHSDEQARAQRGVDVQGAQDQFDALRRTLSRHSSLHRTQTGQKDAEENSEDDFDLLDFLTTTQASARDAGIKRKHVGVTFDDLSVIGNGGLRLHIRTFPDAIWQTSLWAPMYIARLLGAFTPKPKKLLHSFTGSVKPGEMVLVLGRPGSGCSTFLKVFANQRAGFLGVDGDVKYAGVDAKEFSKLYMGETIYSEEDDLHHPTLTVGQTLDFALSLKTPGKLLPSQTKAQFKEMALDTMLKMLNIQHTRNTLVGNAFVRGVSGGERKRVSIAEAMTTRGAVLSWDNSTRGLDASTALDYAKSIRVLTNIYKWATAVSLYQAGEGIYEQFDKILVIDEGRQVYFGPRDKARQYFINLGFADLPRQTTADYLTGCTDPNERRFQEGRDASNVPSTPEQLEAAYRESDICKQELQAMREYREYLTKERAIEEEFRQAVREDKHRGVGKKSPYTVSFFTQVYALWKRQMLLQKNNWFDQVVSYSTAIIIAIIVGSTYLNLPQTAAGGFTRGGLLFIGLLFNALTSFSELPTQMQGRVILFKQQGYTFYRPSALALANVLADIPWSFFRILLFSIILYFMAGLDSSAGAFFTFFINSYILFLAMSALFRVFGTICESYDVAARLAAIIITALVLYAGYVVPRDGMKRWLFWISYLDPVYFGFSAVMINEFMRIDLDCVDTYITPRNPPGSTTYGTTVGPNQVCTLAGSTPGQQVVPGRDYIKAAFGYNTDDLWLNWGVTLIFFVGLQLLTMFVIEVFQHGKFSSALSIYKKEGPEEKKLNARLQERKQAFRSGEAEQDLSGITQSRKPFTWENLNYHVPVAGGQKRLLHDVFGYVKPGSLTALMGASGAGKTTLLDVLADRKSIGVITGDILIAGRPTDVAFQRGCGYCEQQDIHEPTATVREALRFSAYLRQPFETSKEEKDNYVEEIIQLLEMEDLADAMIGFPEFGLGVEARKRVTIGVELAAKPQLLLFLDEPTSGLDGQSAYNVVRFLKKLAAAGQAILCTIHQPNALLFEQFDRLLLLERGGETVYFGPIGQDSQQLINYFAANGAQCPSNVNPAEFMLEAIGAGSGRRIGPKAWSEIYRESDLFQQNLATIKELKEQSLADEKNNTAVNKEKEYSTPFWYQLRVVVARTCLAQWRMADYGFTRLFNHLAIGLFTGLTFLQVDNSSSGLQYRVFAIFIATVMPAIILAQIEPMYIMSRSTFIREDSSKMYHGVVFALAQLTSELFYSVLCAIVYFLSFYYPAGFNTSSDRAGYFFAMILVVEVFAVTLGQAVSALNPSVYLAALANPFLIIIMSLFCGVTIPKPNLPHFWRVWMYQLNPFTRLVSGLVSNELHDLVVVCKDSEFSVFQPPSGQSCGAYGDEFINFYGGYLNNPNATTDCQYCPYRVGDQFYEPLDIDFNKRGRDIGILIAFIGFNAIVTLLAARFTKFRNR